jgi:(heptosyl)LPS beta-1,4-glucosyltransferase
MIDVDEEVSPELRRSIEQVLTAPAPEKVYVFQRLSDFFGCWMYHGGWYPDPVARLYHKDRFRFDDAAVHERLACARTAEVVLDGHLLHYTTADYRHVAGKSVRYACDWADARFSRGKRTSMMGILAHSLGCFVRKYFLQRGMLAGRHGFMLACVSTVYTFNKYAALWALQQRSDRDARA